MNMLPQNSGISHIPYTPHISHKNKPRQFTAPDPTYLSNELFFPLRPWLDRMKQALANNAVPDCPTLNVLARDAGLQTRDGQALVFAPPCDDGLGYEERIWKQGVVETRSGNWHDFFNALIWLAFPRAKAALSGRHAQVLALARSPERPMHVRTMPRGNERDAMTHFDECGALVVASDPELLRLLHDFQWKTLFCTERERVKKEMRCFIFGHATYEQLLAPFPGITAKAVLMTVDRPWLDRPLAEQLDDLDARLAADLATGMYSDSRELSPLPIFGWPGAIMENEDPCYYDDTRVFRPGRMRDAAKIQPRKF